MTDKQIRVAVAEACGWKCVTGDSVQCPYYTFILIDPNNFQFACTHSSVSALNKYLPDYPKDLNATHEMEKVLTFEQAEEYESKLAFICQAENKERENPLPWYFSTIHASARQRCEAFLKTIGKWE